MKRILFCLLKMSFVVLAAANLLGQASNLAKVGVLNVFKAVVECAEGKKTNEDFQKKYEARRSELEAKQTEIQTLQQQLQTQSATLSDDAKAALSKSISTKSTELKRNQEDAEKEFTELRNEIFSRIGSKLAPMVQQYARENNFTMVLDSSNQTSQLFYSDPTVDITNEIIKRYDASQASSNISGGTAPPKPAATAAQKASPAPQKAAGPVQKAPAAPPKKQ